MGRYEDLVSTYTEKEISFLTHCYYTISDYCEWMSFYEFKDRYGEVLLNERDDSPRKKVTA